jgi:hypothetical protein
MMLVGVRRSLNGIAVNAGLLERVARRLEEEKKDVKDLRIGAKA